MAHEKHSESLSTPSRGCRSHSVRHFGGHKRLTVAEVAAVVLMHAPGKMLRTSEIAAGAQKMFVPRYDDPKELSKFRSSLRHELSKFRDVKFFRVPKEHGRAGRGDCWAYVGDGDPRTRALIDRIIQERGHAKDYSKRHHTFEVMAQQPVSESSAPKGVTVSEDHPPSTLTKPTAPQIRPPITHAPTPIFHPSVQAQAPFVLDSLPFQGPTTPSLEFSPTSLSSETFEEAPLTGVTGSTAPAVEGPGRTVASQEPEFLDFGFSTSSTQTPPHSDLDLSSYQSEYFWSLYSIYFGEQSSHNS